MSAGGRKSESITVPAWHFAPEDRVWTGGHDEAARHLVNLAIGPVVRPPTGPLDAVVVTPLTVDECAYFLGKVLPRLAPGGRLWVVFGDSPALSAGAVEAAAASLGLQPLGIRHIPEGGLTAAAFGRRHGQGASAT
jgi:hypothetical protein